jgi:RecA-family ATPase
LQESFAFLGEDFALTRIISANDFAQLSLPDHEWVIPGYLPKPGLLMILGEPRAGKSYLALQLALCLAQGRNLLPGTGVPQVPPQKVLYFYFDKTGVFVFQDRLNSLKASGVNLTGSLYVIHPLDKLPSANLLDHANYDYFKQVIANADPDIVVFDVLREFHNGDENESTEMKIVGDSIACLCEGLSIILVHHTKKLEYPGRTGPVRNVEAARGSNYIVGKADSTWLIHNGGLQVESNFAPATRFKLLRQSNGLWTFV